MLVVVDWRLLMVRATAFWVAVLAAGLVAAGLLSHFFGGRICPGWEGC